MKIYKLLHKLIEWNKETVGYVNVCVLVSVWIVNVEESQNVIWK